MHRKFLFVTLIALMVFTASCGPAATTAPPTAAAPAATKAAPATTAPAPATTAPAATKAAATTAPAATAAPAATKAAATTAPAASPAASGAATTLSIVCRCVAGGANANTVKWITEYVIPKFQEQQKAAGKNVTVNLVQFGGSDEELKARLALDLKSGSGSDLMAFDGFWVPEFVEGGLLKPLDEIAGAAVNSWEGWAHIPDRVQELLKYQNKRYGVPVGSDARVIWYRKDIFKAAGLPETWQPTSWDDVLVAARAIKKAKPEVTPLQINAGTAMGEATTLQGWYMVVLGTGTNVYNFQTGKFPVRGKPILDALTFYKTVYVDEKLGDARMQLLKDGRDRSFLAFRDGTMAMLVEGDFFWRSVLAAGSTKLDNRDQLVGWAKMPAMAPGKGINGQNFVTASGGNGYLLNPNTKNPADAWALASFMFSKASLDFIQGFEPRIRSRDDVPVPNDTVMTAMAKDLLPITAIRPAEAAYSKVVSPEIQLMTERVVSGEMTPQQAMDAYATAVTAGAGANKVEDIK